MTFSKQNLGIDVDSEKLKVSFRRIDMDQNIKTKASRTFKNNASGFTKLEEWAEKNRIPELSIHVTMEATGVYYENVAYFFNEQKDYVVHVLLPNKTAAYKKSLNVKSKTDEIDAKVLAEMGLERKLTVWNPGSEEMRTIKTFTRERLRLQKVKTMISNQLHAENKSHNPRKEAVIRYNAHIDFIVQQIEEIESDIRDEVKKDEDLKARIDNMCTIPGIGFVTAIGLVAETDGFTLFKNRKQLTSYAGYDVIENESGKFKGKTRISKKGNSYIRQILYMPAMSSANHNPLHKKHYDRVVDSTKIKMKASVAIQRKLLLLAYALYKNNTTFDPLYQQKVDKQLEAQRQQKKQFKEQNERKKINDLLNKGVDHAQGMAYSG